MKKAEQFKIKRKEAPKVVPSWTLLILRPKEFHQLRDETKRASESVPSGRLGSVAKLLTRQLTDGSQAVS